MFKRIKPTVLVSLTGILLLTYSCKTGTRLETAKQMVQEVSSKFLPDARTNVFRIQFTIDGQQLIMKGETNLLSAKTALLRKLDSAGIFYLDSLSVLPDARVDSTPYAVVNISVANLRKTHKHSAELVTQALMGTPLKVLNEVNGWYLVKCPDRYIGWVDDGGIALYSADSYNEYRNADKVIVTQRTGTIYSLKTVDSEPVTDVVAGDLITENGASGGYYHISLPDGRTGFLEIDKGMSFNDFLTSRYPDSSSLVTTAESMMGIPYLWGGTSAKGMDCSGFTKTVYFLNGLILPRDADQQAAVGVTVDSVKNFTTLQPGDLLFFGKKSAGNAGITHVGMWIGNMQFINSSGMIKIASMDSTSADFDSYNYNRYIKANRITDKDLALLRIDKNLFKFQ